jgi:hypothetical protein
VHPDWPGSVVFGVVGGTVEQPELVPLAETQPITAELLALSGPVPPTEVFRFAGPCAETRCRHFETDTSRCRLVEKTVRWVPIAVRKPVPCPIRSNCKWWQQEGRTACLRCPQVASSNPASAEALRRAASPMIT